MKSVHPAQPPLPWEDLVLERCRRSAGNVLLPPAAEPSADELPSLSRHASMAGKILTFEDSNTSFLLQRKISPHARIAYRVTPDIDTGSSWKAEEEALHVALWPKSDGEVPKEALVYQFLSSKLSVDKKNHLLTAFYLGEDDHFVYAVTPRVLASIGDMSLPLSEIQARWVMQELLKCLSTLHGAGVCHGNLSADAVACVSDGDNSSSYHLALRQWDHATRPSFDGSHYHVLPSSDLMMTEHCGFATDLCQLGWLLGRLLWGGPHEPELWALPRHVRKRKRQWSSGVSQEAVDLVQSLLPDDARRRPSLEDVQQHAWMTQTSQERPTLAEGIPSKVL